ncbi:aldehyde dehydrogenase family protein [Vibrio kagoshimensis]|uniref:aldehyde dehydrogenase family protein n=1 Tax=Vibrio kagoshimensis TaxID=2910244 RepID=UPI003D237AC1
MNNLSPLSKEEVQATYQRKRNFFDAGKTRDYNFRIAQLEALKNGIKKYENEIFEALHADMRKPRFEATISEINIIYDEIEHTIRHLQEWMKTEHAETPAFLQSSYSAKSEIHYEPLGVVLVIGPWNYPFQLLIAPLIGAIAAGNCALLKPSNETKHTAHITGNIISEIFDEEYISVVYGPGSSVGPLIIENNRFDHIFFTGSPGVGKLIAGMAAKHLTPVTLELGGKSPAIVDKHANLEVTAKRLTWAKFFNAGQTCVCPDYVLVHEDVKDALIAEMKKNITEFFGENPQKSPDFARIVNDKRFNALEKFLTGNIVVGGEKDSNDCYIAPTIIDDVSMNDVIMEEEIFGPIMPVLTWSEYDEALAMIRQNRYPLACYVFSESNETIDFFNQNVEYGGSCINHALLHLTNPDLPFGGVGFSGMGRYHGRDSFLTMSHSKAIMKFSTDADPSALYAPYPQ